MIASETQERLFTAYREKCVELGEAHQHSTSDIDRLEEETQGMANSLGLTEYQHYHTRKVTEREVIAMLPSDEAWTYIPEPHEIKPDPRSGVEDRDPTVVAGGNWTLHELVNMVKVTHDNVTAVVSQPATPEVDRQTLAEMATEWEEKRAAEAAGDDLVIQSFTDPSVEKLVEANPIVDGLFREEEVVNIVAAPKTGKSFAVYQLAIAIENGTSFLGFNVPSKRRVLIIDNELKPQTLNNRMQIVKKATSAERLPDFIAARGKSGINFETLRKKLRGAGVEKYSVLVLDAYYRFLPKGMSENDNAQATETFNELNRISAEFGVSIVNIHHTSKGNQSEKSITDTGAGAGSVSRATDTHVTIREHAMEGHTVFHAVTRTFKQPPAVTARLDWPLWTTCPEINPDLKRADHRDSVRKEETAARKKERARDNRIEFISKITKALRDNPVVPVSKIAGISKSADHTWAENELRRAKVIVEADFIMKGSKITPVSTLTTQEQKALKSDSLTNSRGKAYEVKVAYRLADNYQDRLQKVVESVSHP